MRKKRIKKQTEDSIEDLFEIIPEPPDYSLSDALEKADHTLTKLITERISYAVDNNLDYVEIAKILMPGGYLILKSTKENFIETLEANIQKLVNYEDYENCAKCKKYLEILKNESL